MKKIFTLTVGLMLTVAMFAANRNPIVTINSADNGYMIVVDGHQYLRSGYPIDLSDLACGQHEIKTYKQRPGTFGSTQRLVDLTNFQVSENGNTQVSIDCNGQIQISESRFGNSWNDRDNGLQKDYGKGYSRDSRISSFDQHDKRHHNGKF